MTPTGRHVGVQGDGSRRCHSNLNAAHSNLVTGRHRTASTEIGDGGSP